MSFLIDFYSLCLYFTITPRSYDSGSVCAFIHWFATFVSFLSLYSSGYRWFMFVIFGFRKLFSCKFDRWFTQMMSEFFWADSAKKVFLEKVVQLLAPNLRSLFGWFVRNIFFRDDQGDVQAVGATILSFFFRFCNYQQDKKRWKSDWPRVIFFLFFVCSEWCWTSLRMVCFPCLCKVFF